MEQEQANPKEGTGLPALITPKQAAAFIGVSEKYVREMCQQGTIKATKLGGVWRIGRDALFAQFPYVATR